MKDTAAAVKFVYNVNGASDMVQVFGGQMLSCETKNVIDDRASFQLLHHIAPLVPKVVVVDKGKGTRNSSMNHMEVVLRPFTFCVRVCLLRYLLEKKM